MNINENRLTHTRNMNGEVSMWANPATCSCSVCQDYCQEHGIVAGASSAGASSASSEAPAESPRLERQNAVILGDTTTPPGSIVGRPPHVDDMFDITMMESMIRRWRQQAAQFQRIFDEGHATRQDSASLANLLERIVETEHLIETIRTLQRRLAEISGLQP